MKILVANLGSTSFKYKLIDTDSQQTLGSGGIERIGDERSAGFWEIGENHEEFSESIPDHGAAVEICLKQLTAPDTGCLRSADEVSAIGFKAVHGGKFSGTVQVNEDVLAEMQRMNPVAPAHNPVYIAAMRQLKEACPSIPLIASFETGFHADAPDENRLYAIPKQWSEEFGVQRFGFHGASHRFVAEKSAELLEASKPSAESSDLKVISLHLGGSSSICGIRGGKSLGASMGMSPQTGLPQNNRVGDFDPFALPVVMNATGKSLEEVLEDLGNKSGLLGMSGKSGDVRDLREGAQAGDEDCRKALDVFVAEIRRHIGGFVMQMGRPDAVVFTGGIGQNDWMLRRDVCKNLQWLGLELDESQNESSRDQSEISSESSRVKVWIIPTNEEWIVARQAKEFLEEKSCS